MAGWPGCACQKQERNFQGKKRKEKKSVGSVKLISSDSLLKELYKHFLPFDSSSSSCLEIYVFVYQKNTQQQQLEREQEERGWRNCIAPKRKKSKESNCQCLVTIELLDESLMTRKQFFCLLEELKSKNDESNRTSAAKKNEIKIRGMSGIGCAGCVHVK